jgi:two-component system phosphate regulon sensor histidine kinase PhoR
LSNPAAEHLLGDRLADGLSEIEKAFEWPSGDGIETLHQGAALEVRLTHPANTASAPHMPDTGDATGSTDGDRWIEMSAYPVVAPDHEVSASGGKILVMRDVTTARNARNVRDAFLGILSHELRTPVTTIYGGSEMLSRRGGKVSEEIKLEVLNDIRAEADRLYRLVENLLVLSRVERQGLHIDTEPVLLQRLVPRVIDGESARWAGARFVTELPAGLPPVAAEETYVEQVLRNLVGNAAKYGGDGPVTVTANDNGGTVQITVRDCGPGFPDDERGRLFELFYRSPSLARTASGAGIGLFVCRQLIAAMKGRMWAANAAGGGAQFGFEIPIFQAAD